MDSGNVKSGMPGHKNIENASLMKTSSMSQVLNLVPFNLYLQINLLCSLPAGTPSF